MEREGGTEEKGSQTMKIFLSTKYDAVASSTLETFCFHKDAPSLEIQMDLHSYIQIYGNEPRPVTWSSGVEPWTESVGGAYHDKDGCCRCRVSGGLIWSLLASTVNNKGSFPFH